MDKFSHTKEVGIQFAKVLKMTPILFAYWLQGFFEMFEAIGFTEVPEGKKPMFYGCVQAHLNLCKETEGDFNPKLVTFLGWVESAIEFDVDPSKIKSKLHDIFEHVIDPMLVQDKVKQSLAHQSSGGWNSPYGDGVKC